MTQFRSNPALSSSEAPTGLFSRWVCFWFRPADPLALHLIRLLAGLLFLSWLLPFAGQIQAFFSLDGWLDRRALSELVRLPEDLAPQLSWSLLYLCGSNVTLLTVMYWVSIAILVLFTLGVWPRILAVLTWLIVVSFTANPAISFDAETLLIVLAFYLMVGYLLDGLPSSLRSPGRLRALAGPLLVWPLRRPGATPARRESVAANLTLRLMQVHFAIVMVATGLDKLQSGDWWAGVPFWHFVYSPFEITPEKMRDYADSGPTTLGVLSLLAYLCLAWQLTFPLFAWRPRWRALLLGGAVIGWLGNALLYDLPLFGPLTFLFCLSYVSPAECHRLARVPFVAEILKRFSVVSRQARKPGPKSPRPTSVVSGRNP